jgi:hypothetical protein
MNLIFLALLSIVIPLQAGVIGSGPNKAVLSQTITVGPNGTGSCTNAGAGTSWSNTTNATADDDAFATAGLLASSRLLACTQYGFSITGTVVGIKLEFDRKSGADDIQDSDVQLTKDGTTAVGDDKAAGGNWPTTSAFATYGGSSDLWGTTWTSTEINASTFGSLVRATTVDGDTASVDYCRVTVYYQ